MELWQQILNGVFRMIVRIAGFFADVIGFDVPDTSDWVIF
jgi:hypothetical protein